MFCSVEDVRLALAPLADWSDTNATAATLEDSQIADAIREAEGVLALYLSRYRIELIEYVIDDGEGTVDVYEFAPPPVRGWTRSIAAYLAALTFRKHKDLTEDDPIRLRYAMVMDALKDIRDRKSDLDLPITGGVNQGVHVENLYDGHMFGLSDVGLGYEGSQSQVLWPAERYNG